MTICYLQKEGDWLLAYPPSKHFRAIAEGGGLAFGLSPFQALSCYCGRRGIGFWPIPLLSTFVLLRKEGDSNPRNGHPFTGFRDQRDRPLCHPSSLHILLPRILSSVSMDVSYSIRLCVHRAQARLVHLFAVRAVPNT